MERVEQLLALIAEQLSTNNTMMLEMAVDGGILTKESCAQFLKEISDQSDILTLIEKEAKKQYGI